MRRHKADLKKPFSAQDTIGFEAMWPDGVCQVTERRFSKMVEFQDINYRLAKPEEKDRIFNGWCALLNTFDPDIRYQFSFLNSTTNEEEFEARVSIKPRGDDFDDIREEYTDMLLRQLEKGNNAITRRKFLTFSVEAGSVKLARVRLEQIELGLSGEMRRIGISVQPLDGKERLRIMHGIFHMDTQEQLNFEWDWLLPSGLNVKDFIAPSSFDFRERNAFRMGKRCCCVSMLQILSPAVTDEFLTDMLRIDVDMMITMHVRSVRQVEALKMLRRKMTDLDRSKIEEQKKAVRAGYDMDILPASITSYGTDVRNQVEALEKNNERMFMMTFLVMNMADSPKELKRIIDQMNTLATQNNCQFMRLDFQQEQGMVSSLPLGCNQIQVERNMTTRSLGNLIPFVTRELFQDSERALYYGLNASSGNLIMADRTLLKNPNGLIIGTSGSGKSFAAKREALNAFLVTDDDVMICDPEGEYYPMVQALHGQVIHISPTSKDYINPMDISLSNMERDDVLRLKSDFILSMCELLMGSKNGIEAFDRSIIDRAIPMVYAPYFADPRPETMPTLGDLHHILLNQDEKEAHRIATILEIYVTGSLNLFNHRTNVDIHNRLVCYDIKDLGKQLKKLGMLIVQDQVWARVSANRDKGRYTRYYIDEFHLLLKEEQTAAYSVEIWKRFRKWGGIPTGITQNIKDFMNSHEVQNIVENSDFKYILSQGAGDRDILVNQLGLSKDQIDHITQAGVGQGLLSYDNVIIPFIDRFPKGKLYQIMTTKLSDLTDSSAQSEV